MNSCLAGLRVAARVAAAIAFTVWASAPLLAQPPQPQDGFVPVSDTPVQEQLPAAPLLVAAYIFVLAALFVYVVSLARRLAAVQQDVQRLEGDLKRRGRD